MRNNESNFRNLHENSVRFCDDNKIDIPVIRRIRISIKIYRSSHTQLHIVNTKEKEKFIVLL